MYIVIEKWPSASIVTDESGEVKYFPTLHEACEEAAKCQFGQVVFLEEYKDYENLPEDKTNYVLYGLH